MNYKNQKSINKTNFDAKYLPVPIVPQLQADQVEMTQTRITLEGKISMTLLLRMRRHSLLNPSNFKTLFSLDSKLWLTFYISDMELSGNQIQQIELKVPKFVQKLQGALKKEDELEEICIQQFIQHPFEVGQQYKQQSSLFLEVLLQV